MTKEQKKAIEKIKRQITIGECEKNIGIPVYISDLKTILSMLEEKDKEYEELTESSEALSKAVNLMKKVMNEMAKVICMLDTMNNYETWNNDIEEVKEYFYKKVEDKR